MNLLLLAQATQPAAEEGGTNWQRVILLGDPLPVLELASQYLPLLILGLLAVATGVAFCLLGWRFFTPLLRLAWGLRAGPASGMLAMQFTNDLLLSIVIGIAVGVFFAWLAGVLREIVVGLMTAGWAGSIAVIGYLALWVFVFPDHKDLMKYAWVPGLLVAIPFFIIGVVKFRAISMFIMSAMGALFIMTGLATMFLPVFSTPDLSLLQSMTALLILGAGGLALVGGTIFQVLMVKRKEWLLDQKRKQETEKTKQFTGLRLGE